MSLTDTERETIINMNDGEPTAYIYSAQRKVITRLRNNPAAVLTEEGTHEGSAWARFTIPAELVSFRTGRVRLELTEEQRRERGERLRSARQGSAKTA